MVMRPCLLIVQGAPGTGKTTVARRLSKDLAIDCFSKDAFKELLYDSIGAPTSVDDTKRYGRISIRAIYSAADEYLHSGRDVMIEAPLEAQFALSDLAAIAASDHIIQVHVICDPNEQVERFNARLQNNERHAGHIDTVLTVDAARATQARNNQLSGFTTYTIDTSTGKDGEYETVLANIKEELS